MVKYRVDIEIPTKKRILYYVLLLIGVLGIIDSACLMVYTNINVGIVFPGIVGLFLVAYSSLKLLIYKTKPMITNQVLKYLLMIGIGLFSSSFILIESMILYNITSQEGFQSEYVIILGAGLNGEVVSLSLKERLDKAITYLNQYPKAEVIVSGGQSLGEKTSEAAAMKKYLIRNGIDTKRILVEDQSTSTMENFEFSKKILSKVKDKDITKIMVVTSDFHMLRAKMIARRNGFEPYGITCETPISVRINCYLREYFALVKTYFLDK